MATQVYGVRLDPEIIEQFKEKAGEDHGKVARQFFVDYVNGAVQPAQPVLPPNQPAPKSRYTKKPKRAAGDVCPKCKKFCVEPPLCPCYCHPRDTYE